MLGSKNIESSRLAGAIHEIKGTSKMLERWCRSSRVVAGVGTKFLREWFLARSLFLFLCLLLLLSDLVSRPVVSSSVVRGDLEHLLALSNNVYNPVRLGFSPGLHPESF